MTAAFLAEVRGRVFLGESLYSGRVVWQGRPTPTGLPVPARRIVFRVGEHSSKMQVQAALLEWSREFGKRLEWKYGKTEKL